MDRILRIFSERQEMALMATETVANSKKEATLVAAASASSEVPAHSCTVFRAHLITYT